MLAPPARRTPSRSPGQKGTRGGKLGRGSPWAAMMCLRRTSRARSGAFLLDALAEAQDAVADADGVAGADRRRAGNADLVEERAARRASVVEEIAGVAADDTGVQFLDARVAEQTDVARLGAT